MVDCVWYHVHGVVVATVQDAGIYWVFTEVAPIIELLLRAGERHIYEAHHIQAFKIVETMESGRWRRWRWGSGTFYNSPQ